MNVDVTLNLLFHDASLYKIYMLMNAIQFTNLISIITESIFKICWTILGEKYKKSLM